jgi:hypothetical protein
MKEKDPLEKFFEEISKLVELAQNKELKPTDKFPEDIEQRLSEIEKNLQTFVNVNDRLIAEAGITASDIEKIIAKPDHLSADRRNLIDRTKKLKGVVEDIQRNYLIASSVAKKNEPYKGTKNKQVLARKKKFRGMGGTKDWKPM